MIKSRLYWLAIPLTIILTLVIADRYALNFPAVYLVLINVTTFFLFGFDKTISAARITRVPENVLLTLSLLGGILGAISAIYTLRHKTQTRPFLVKVWIILVVQIILYLVYSI